MIILDTDSSVRMANKRAPPTTVTSVSYHPLFGSTVRVEAVRPARQRSQRPNATIRLYFRGDAAFAAPEMYEYLEADCTRFGLPKTLQESVDDPQAIRARSRRITSFNHCASMPALATGLGRPKRVGSSAERTGSTIMGSWNCRSATMPFGCTCPRVALTGFAEPRMRARQGGPQSWCCHKGIERCAAHRRRRRTGRDSSGGGRQ